MSRKVFIILFFACFGMTCEIFFVAFQNLINQTPLFEESLWSLTGKTYVWMFPIYALIPVLGKLLFEKLSKYPLLVRSLTYTTLIFLVEFSSGFLLEAITANALGNTQAVGILWDTFALIILRPGWSFL